MSERPLRSVLFLPASNPRAIDKARSLPCDAVVLDLEDATAPEHKEAARTAAVEALGEGGFGARVVVVRVNALDTRWGADDLAALAGTRPDAVLLPKVAGPEDVRDYAALAPEGVSLWAMIETCRAVLQLDAVAAYGHGLTALVLGTNDLSKDMRRPLGPDRRALYAAMSRTVTAARAFGLHAIDGVFNGLDDAEGLTRESEEGRAFGFDGKSLIHPNQIEPANRAFSPSEAELAWAQAVVDGYASADAEAGDAGAIRVGGAMVERLHLAEAERMLRMRA